MSLWRKGGIKRNYILAVLILVAGFGGLFGYDLYFKPYVLAQPVVKVRSGEGGVLPKNHKLRTEDLYLDTVQTKDVPAGAITKLEQVEQKVTNVNLTEGSILTESLVDIDRLEPAAGEGVFPIPKDSIYAVNGTLRSRDKVDIYLMEGEQQQRMRSEGRPGVMQSPERTGNAGGGSAESGMHRGAAPDKLPEEAFLTSVTVNYVRTEDNNDVQDSDQGNTNQRYTSTGKVASPELKLRKEDGQRLKQYLEQGWKLWIVRVE